jgi:photosystem II stability/assembly factor-like uncharacterized protein
MPVSHSLPLRVAAVVAVMFAAHTPSSSLAGIGSWTTNGPYGGIVNTLVVDPTNSATLYAAAPGSGVFKSTNRGVKWVRSGRGLTDPTCFTLAIDPVKPAILYTAGGNGVFRTINGGASWALVAGLVNVRQIVIDPKTPTTLYATVDQGPLYRSTDSGKTWTSLFNNLRSHSIATLAIDPTNSNNLYAGAEGDTTSSTPGGVYRSTNAGKTWTLSNRGLGTGFIAVTQIFTSRASPSVLFVEDSGLKRSSDRGKTWVAVKTNNTNVIPLVRDPERPGIFYGVEYPGTIYATGNSGITWKALPSITTPAFQGGVRTVAVDPANSSRLYAGTDHGVFASANSGKSWVEANQGLANTLVTALAINPKAPDTVYAGTEYGGIFKTRNGGLVWTRVDADWLDKVTSLLVDPTNPSTLYFGSIFGQGVFKSIDSGAAWTNILPYTLVLSMALDPTAPSTLFYSGGSGALYKSSNAGKSWFVSNKGLPVGIRPGSVSAFGQSVLLTDPISGAFRSANGGTTWAADDPMFANVASAGRSRVDAQTNQPFKNFADGIVAGATGAFIENYITVDSPLPNGALGFAKNNFKGGATFDTTSSSGWTPWAPPSGVMPGNCPPLAAIVADPTNPATFYAGGQCGVLKGTNTGKKLVAMNSGLPVNISIDALAIAPSGKTVYAGAYGGGVYSYSIP